MAAAPLRAPGGDVIGTLAVSSATPRDFLAEELDLLQGLADQAAIAITNSTLLTRLSESEERYRFLVENAPDLVWSIGSDARLTFLSDAVERLTGHRPEELLGQHFGVLVHESSREVAELDWSAGMAAGSQELRGRVNLRGPDGEPVPSEFIAIARLDEDGSFAEGRTARSATCAGATGSSASCASRSAFPPARQTTPDVITAATRAEFLFMAEGSEALFGWKPPGRGHDLRRPDGQESLPLAVMNFESQREERDVVRRYRYMLKHRDGSVFPAAISSVSVWEDDKFAGVRARSAARASRSVSSASCANPRALPVPRGTRRTWSSRPTRTGDSRSSRRPSGDDRLLAQRGGRPALLDAGQPDSMPIAGDRWAKLVADPPPSGSPS
jgi:PAS domain S-box-containing protein